MPRLRLTSARKWAFGIHSWRFVTFPVALAVSAFVAVTSPVAIIRGIGWLLVAFYAVAFVLVLAGALKLPER
jgi:hypothetical protein